MQKLCMAVLAVLMTVGMVFSPAVFAADDKASSTGLVMTKELSGLNTAQTVGISFHTHVQNEGWEPNWATSEGTAGTQGQGLRLEGIEIKLFGDLPEGAKIEYRTHVQDQGWEKYWTCNGNASGSQGMGLRLEGIQIRLVNMPNYSIEYRTHVQNWGWETTWAKDGTVAGSQGQGLRLEGIQIRIIKNDADLTAYKKILTTVNSSVKTSYTTYSWDNLQKVKTANVVTVKNTQAEVDAATDAIQTAFDGLESEAAAMVYSKAGTYGPASGLEVIKQDVIIKTDGVTLQNLHIKGDLIISEEVGQGNATLNNITVDGETYIRGGGKNSIHINGGNYKKITVQETASGQVRIVATNAVGLDIVIAEDAKGEELILEGTFGSVQVDAPGMKISTRGTTVIGEMTMTKFAAGSQVTLDSSTRVDRMVFNGKTNVRGQGKIIKADVNADNVTYEKAPEQQTISPTVRIPPKIPTISVTAISVNSPGSVTSIVKGTTLQMSAIVTPTTATNKDVTWTVKNGSGTASISTLGLLAPLTVGTVTVTATAKDGSTKFGSLDLTITDLPAAKITTSSAAIVIGTANPDVEITLVNDTFTSVANLGTSWTGNMGTTGLSIASVTLSGSTKAIVHLQGTALSGTLTLQPKITALTRGAASNALSIPVQPIAVTAVSVSPITMILTAGGATAKMVPTITPSDATNKTVTWTTSNADIATVAADGTVTPKTAGTATITATTIDGSKTASSAVTVKAPLAITDIIIDSPEAIGKNIATATIIANKGATVNSIQIVMNEEATLTAGTKVKVKVPGASGYVDYGSIALGATNKKVLIITPNPGNGTIGIAGETLFQLSDAGAIKDLAGSTYTGTMPKLFVPDVGKSTVSRDPGNTGGSVIFDPAANTFTGTVDYYPVNMSIGRTVPGNYLGVKIAPPSGVTVDTAKATFSYTKQDNTQTTLKNSEVSWLNPDNTVYYYPMVTSARKSFQVIIDWDGEGMAYAPETININADACTLAPV